MARVGSKMGLVIWDKLADIFSHNQQADNWSKIEYHDHTPNRGVQIPNEGLASNSVTLSKVAPAQIIRGRVASTGTIAGGTGFSINKTGTGVYVITYTTAFAAIPALVVHSRGGVSADITAESATAATVTTGGVDRAFHFIAVIT